MPTQTKENYLKALYHLHQKDSAISVSELGKVMEVSKPTVNAMVKTMQSNGWVEYEKYRPLSLTKLGLKEASLVIRKHRLSEMFLTNIMGFGWEEVHDMAEEMEHIQSEPFFDRMDELLGYPTKDPHGSPIPDKNGQVAKNTYKTLTQLKEGDKAVLKAIKNSNSEFLLYLNKKNIELGLEITIKQIEPFDQSVIINSSKFSEMYLTHEIAASLLVKLL